MSKIDLIGSGLVIHLARYFNASRNILLEGLKTISDGTLDYKGGEEIRPEIQAVLCQA